MGFSSVDNCYATGTVLSSEMVGGGLVGAAHGAGSFAPVSIHDSFATGSVGKISGEPYDPLTEAFGGLLGWGNYNVSFGGNAYDVVNNHYYDHAGNPAVGVGNYPDPGAGCANFSDAVLQTGWTAAPNEEHFFSGANAPLNGWDFTDTWAINEGIDYPCLRWQINTPVGSSVIVPLPPDVTLIFDEVTQGGHTTLVASDSPPEGYLQTDHGFQAGYAWDFWSVTDYYDIESSALYEGQFDIRVCYDQQRFDDTWAAMPDWAKSFFPNGEADLKLWHFTPGLLPEDITVSIDIDNNVICGRSDSFSDFFVGFRTPIAPEPTSLTLVALGALGLVGRRRTA
jgi:hypothetical protein